MLAVTQVGAGYTAYVASDAGAVLYIQELIPLHFYIGLCGLGALLMLWHAFKGWRLNGFAVFPLGAYLVYGAYDNVLSGDAPFNAFVYAYLFVDILWMIAYNAQGASSLIDWLFRRMMDGAGHGK
jgi:hypothetical protein